MICDKEGTVHHTRWRCEEVVDIKIETYGGEVLERGRNIKEVDTAVTMCYCEIIGCCQQPSSNHLLSKLVCVCVLLSVLCNRLTTWWRNLLLQQVFSEEPGGRTCLFPLTSVLMPVCTCSDVCVRARTCKFVMGAHEVQRCTAFSPCVESAGSDSRLTSLIRHTAPISVAQLLTLTCTYAVHTLTLGRRALDHTILAS